MGGVASEASVPVDRPNLSKDYLAGTAPEEWIPLGSVAAGTPPEGPGPPPRPSIDPGEFLRQMG